MNISIKDKIGFSTSRHNNTMGILVALVAMCVILSIASGSFLRASNLLNVLQQMWGSSSNNMALPQTVLS